MSIWLSLVLLSALLGYSAASTRLSKADAAELDELLSKLSNKIEAPAEASLRSHQQSGVEEINGQSVLYGVTYLGDKIYVVEEDSNTIQVYDSNSLSVVDSIVVKGLKRPIDLTGCEDSNLLFVLNGHPYNDVFQVNPVTHKSLELELIESEGDQATTLSCSNGNLVLTSKYTSKLFVYNIKSKNVQTIELPRFIIARHAVETDSGTFFVSHTAYKGRFNNDGVTEFDSDGNELSTYGGERGDGDNQLNRPTYLALLNDGGVLVADFENRRVVQLNEDLTSSSVVITSQDLLSRVMADDGSTNGLPWRLSINKDGTELAVGQPDGKIQIYRI